MPMLSPATDVRTLRLWWLPLITGSAWVIVSIVILRFDYTSVTAISVLFGLVALGTAITEAAVAVLIGGGWRILHAVLAGLFTLAGITSFFHPGDTFVALAALISFYLIFRGISDITVAISMSRVMPAWWVSLVTGFLELLLGFWAAGSWNLSVTLLVSWVGAAVLLHGISEIFTAFRLRV